MRFVAAYDPDKVYVALPLLEDRLPQAKPLAFAALKSDHLPLPALFSETLFQGLVRHEAELSEFSKENAIEFVLLCACNSLDKGSHYENVN